MKKLSNLILATIITFFLILLLSPAKADSITGYARVVDGDTIEVAGEKIRLACVDTPESNYRGKTQYCLDNETDCGLLAKRALESFIDNEEVTCFYEKRDVYGRILGFCQASFWGTELNHVDTYNYDLAYNGFAWYYNGGKECNIYKKVFEEARKDEGGLFQDNLGGFKEPKLWRKTRSND